MRTTLRAVLVGAAAVPFALTTAGLASASPTHVEQKDKQVSNGHDKKDCDKHGHDGHDAFPGSDAIPGMGGTGMPPVFDPGTMPGMPPMGGGPGGGNGAGGNGNGTGFGSGGTGGTGAGGTGGTGGIGGTGGTGGIGGIGGTGGTGTGGIGGIGGIGGTGGTGGIGGTGGTGAAAVGPIAGAVDATQSLLDTVTAPTPLTGIVDPLTTAVNGLVDTTPPISTIVGTVDGAIGGTVLGNVVDGVSGLLNGVTNAVAPGTVTTPAGLVA